MNKAEVNDPESTISYLKKTRLFGDVPVEYLSKLADISELMKLDPSSVVLKEGDPNHSLFLLVEGSLAVNLSGKPIIKLFRKGDIVGEMSLINKKPCTATVAADSSSVILRVDGQKLNSQGFLEDDVSTGIFYRVFSMILSDKLVLTTAKAKDYETANRELLESRQKLQKAYEESLEEIAKRIAAEQELKRHKEHLEEIVDKRLSYAKQAQQNAESASRLKSDFLTSISHELRTPLQAILSFARLGIDKIDRLDKDKIVDYFGNINTAGYRLLSLLNDLLDLAKLEAGKMDFNFQESGISNLVVNILEEFDALSEQGKIQFDFQRPDPEPMIQADPFKLMQVIRNLVSNAVKFSAQGDIISIRIEKLPDTVEVFVSDQGVGIPEDELVSIFEKFSQSRRTTTGVGGTGLGLAICKEIIDAHQGQIWAGGNSDGGAVLTFSLPIK